MAYRVGVRVMLQRVDVGATGGPRAIKQIVGGADWEPKTIEQPTNNTLNITGTQLDGLMAYIGLLEKIADTSAVETAIATLVASS